MGDFRETFVRALYLGLLDREPDEGGLQHHLSLVNPTDPGSMARLMRSFIQVDEGVEVWLPFFFNRLAACTPSRTVSGLPVRHVVSLGSHCFTSYHLKACSLKRWSGPFDWIFSSPAMIMHCIEDNFLTFLDRRFYAPCGQAGGTDHEYYRKKFNIYSIFNHHRPNEDEHYEYFSRCALRFQSILENGEPTLFVLFSLHTLDMQYFRPLATLLESRNPNAALLFVVVNPEDGSRPIPEVRLADEVRQHTAWAMHPIAKLGSFRFENAVDELTVHRLIRQYAISL